MSCRSQGNIKTCNIYVYGNMKNKRNILVIILILSFLMPFYSKDQEIPTKYLPGSRMPSSYSVVKHEKKPDNINFLGLPDDQEIRKIISDDPRVEVVIITKVRMTSTDLSDERFTTLPTQQIGRYLYFVWKSTDAYVFPGSTLEKPHTIIYDKTERFVGYVYTTEEKEAIAKERTRQLHALYRAYSRADPKHEVMRALANNDRRLVAVMGGISASTEINSNTIRQLGCKIIPYTSDCFQSEIEEKFNGTAYFFAKQYNDILIKHVHK